MQPAHFTIKSPEWSYEREWRVFQLLERCDHKLIVKGEAVHLFNIPAEAIKRVICGCQMSDEHRDKVVDLVHVNPKLRHVAILHSSPDLETFRFVYTRSRPLKPLTPVGI